MERKNNKIYEIKKTNEKRNNTDGGRYTSRSILVIRLGVCKHWFNL